MFEYAGFLSYCSTDSREAAWLQKALEAYVIPKRMRAKRASARLGRVFRDRTDYPAGASLTADTHTKIAASEHLVVLLSSDTPDREWVNQEVLAFKRSRPTGRIIPVVSANAPKEAAPNAMMPQSLRYEISTIGHITDVEAHVLCADLRADKDGRKDGLLKVIAGLLGVDLDNLRARELEAQGARARVRAGLVGVFASLALVASALAVVAQQQSERRQRLLTATQLTVFQQLLNVSAMRLSGEIPDAAMLRIVASADALLETAEKEDASSILSSALRGVIGAERCSMAFMAGRTDEAATVCPASLATARAAMRRAPADQMALLAYISSLSVNVQYTSALGRTDDTRTLAAELAQARNKLAAVRGDAVQSGSVTDIRDAERRGDLELLSNRPNAAAEAFASAIAALDAIPAVSRANDPEHQRTVARLLGKLARTQMTLGLGREAAQTADRAVKESLVLVELQNQSPGSLTELAYVLDTQVETVRRLGELPRALTLCNQLLAVTERAVAGNPEGMAIAIRSSAYARRADIYEGLSRYREAVQDRVRSEAGLTSSHGLGDALGFAFRIENLRGIAQNEASSVEERRFAIERTSELLVRANAAQKIQPVAYQAASRTLRVAKADPGALVSPAAGKFVDAIARFETDEAQATQPADFWETRRAAIDIVRARSIDESLLLYRGVLAELDSSPIRSRFPPENAARERGFTQERICQAYILARRADAALEACARRLALAQMAAANNPSYAALEDVATASGKLTLVCLLRDDADCFRDRALKHFRAASTAMQKFPSEAAASDSFGAMLSATEIACKVALEQREVIAAEVRNTFIALQVSGIRGAVFEAARAAAFRSCGLVR
jgi:hypothetical protein